jgi:hypothetical protein
VLLAVVVVAAVGSGAGARRADALSCVPPERLVAGADHAFIGVLTARSGDRLVFRVTEAAIGGVPAVVAVRDDLAATWPMPGAPGDQLALVIRAEGPAGLYVTDRCGVVPPALLRARAVRLVRPRRIVVRRGRARMALRCTSRCRGTFVLRDADGTVLARAPFASPRGRSVVAGRRAPAPRRPRADRRGGPRRGAHEARRPRPDRPIIEREAARPLDRRA